MISEDINMDFLFLLHNGYSYRSAMELISNVYRKFFSLKNVPSEI